MCGIGPVGCLYKKGEKAKQMFLSFREKYGKSLQKSKRKKVVPESTSESDEDFEGLPVKPPM